MTLSLVTTLAQASVRSTTCSDNRGRFQLEILEDNQGFGVSTGKIKIRDNFNDKDLVFKIDGATETKMYHIVWATSKSGMKIQVNRNPTRKNFIWDYGKKEKVYDLTCTDEVEVH